uniref:Retrovirus-related Pol polyprotein from transposon TNT 1-94-like beta-barrel domain-containing protein n=1 Tax=Timema monikensis TaxID=170555 RepID=A0A7R9HP34_9NEOP|nr:unnamed protein product [Timema monikensis]
MDSGISSHMTWHRDYFDKFEKISDGSSVRLGDNHKLFVRGKGDVMIRKLLNGQWYDSVIRDVLFVPELKKNLMSEGKITKLGMKIVLNEHARHGFSMGSREHDGFSMGSRGHYGFFSPSIGPPLCDVSFPTLGTILLYRALLAHCCVPIIASHVQHDALTSLLRECSCHLLSDPGLSSIYDVSVAMISLVHVPQWAMMDLQIHPTSPDGNALIAYDPKQHNSSKYWISNIESFLKGILYLYLLYKFTIAISRARTVRGGARLGLSHVSPYRFDRRMLNARNEIITHNTPQ